MSAQIERTYLEIRSINKLLAKNKPFKDLYLEKVNPPDFQLNKFFYKQVGKKYHWVDRLNWADKNWIDYISSKNLLTFVLKDKNDLAGYFELIIHDSKKEVEIAYFGLLEEYFQKKLGGYLLTEALKKSFSMPGIKRVWFHTCSYDHQNGIKNYLSRGMSVFKTETINL